MTADEFRAALAARGYSQRGFAAYTGSNEPTVRRWALGEQDIPPWVPVLMGLMAEAHQDATHGGATYDPEADAISVNFRPDGAEYEGSDEVAPGIILDYDKQGRVIAVELLYVRELLARGSLSALTPKTEPVSE